MSRKINHFRRIINEEPMGIRMIDTGMMIRFRYNREKVTDRNPLCLYLWRDKKTRLVHTVNLNYLYPTKVEKLYKEIAKNFPLRNVPTGKEEKRYTDIEFARSGANSAKTLYERVLKPKILPTEDAYRTYHQKFMTDIRAVHYDFTTIKGM